MTQGKRSPGHEQSECELGKFKHNHAHTNSNEHAREAGAEPRQREPDKTKQSHASAPRFVGRRHTKVRTTFV